MNFEMEKKKKSNINDINSEVLPELIQLIFSKLPFFNLPSCRLVCKAWSNLLLTCKFHPPCSTSNLFFVHNSPYDHNLHCLDLDPNHLDGTSSIAKFSFHPNFPLAKTISIVNSCNGLLCCFVLDNARTETLASGVYILNPMTNEYFKPLISDTDIRYHYYGFGFSPKTKQYKLARLSFVRDKRATMIEIFTFGPSCKWTTICFLPSDMRVKDHGVYFNGGLYWVGSRKRPHRNVLYRLDLEDETLKEISFSQRGCYFCFVGVFNGTLCLTLCTLDFKFAYHVRKMEEDFSWTKVFDFVIPQKYLHLPFHFQLITTCEDGKMLCLLGGFYLILYDPKTEETKLLTEHNVKKVHHIDSFNFDSLPNILAVDA